MLKVTKHGARVRITFPGDNTTTDAVRVTFEERGRSGANSALSDSSDFLDSVDGDKTGLDQVRTHTQNIRTSLIEKWPVGREIPGHINRIMTSEPAMAQQENVRPRIIDGKRTYFQTQLGPNPEPDKDYRISSEVILTTRPNLAETQLHVAEVQVLEGAQAAPAGAPAVAHEDLAGPGTTTNA